MKKKIIAFFTVILSLFVITALIPYPQRIKRTYFAVNSFGGEEATITSDITYLRFLFRKNRMVGDITVTSKGETTRYTENELQYIGLYPLDNEDENLHFLLGFYWNTDIVTHNDIGETESGDFEFVRAYLSKDFNKIVLYHTPGDKSKNTEPKQYIGNVGKNKYRETFEYFGEYIS